ncbi:MAG: hypothetical protein KAT29_06560, partial [Anaerolineales bacterium]|nr:hypothetical protein [Anaerolineales bacterium]
TEEDRIVTATFSVAPFGIGLPFSEAFIAPNPIKIFVPAQAAARGHVIWNPPDFGGKFCVRVELESEGHEAVWSQRNIDVGEPLEPGQQHSMVFEVGIGPHQGPVTVTLGLIRHKENWDIDLSTRTLANVHTDETVSVTLSVTPSTDAELGSGDPIADVEAFVDGQLLGGFRKLDIPPVPLHKPHEKSYAESEISIDPYPPQKGEVSTVSTVIQNNSEVTQSVDLEFGWAQFGIGIPFTSTGMDPITASVELGPVMSQTVTSEWIPELTGHQCIQIHLTDPDGIYEPQLSQRNVDVEEPPPCGETKVYTVTVYNDSSYTATVDVGMITFNVPSDWQVTVEPTPTLSLEAFASGDVTVTVQIPCALSTSLSINRERVESLQSTVESVPIIDVEGYIEGNLVGGIELQFPSSLSEDRRLYMPLIYH